MVLLCQSIGYSLYNYGYAECNGEWKKKREKKRNREKSSKDWSFGYTKALLWRGLGEMARYDALRENYGPRIIMHWRFDIIEFMMEPDSKHRQL